MSNGNTLQGKGIWARPRAGATTELERAITIAQRAGGTHILYKVADGTTYYENSAQAAQRIRDANLIPLAWMWIKLIEPEEEASVISRAFQEGFQGMALNVEDNCGGKFSQARTLVSTGLEAGLNPNHIYNCSFPNILSHQNLPYTELNELCRGGLMPMAYGAFFTVSSPSPWEQQATTVIDRWTYGHYERWCSDLTGDCPPVYPVLAPYHDSFGSARMGAEEFQIWLDKLEGHKPTFFSIFTANVIDDPLLPGIRNFTLGGVKVEVPEEPEAKTVWVHSIEGAVLYGSLNPAPRRVGAAIYGAALEKLSERTGPDGTPWYRVRTAAGTEGWVLEERTTTTDPGPPPSLPDPPPPPTGQLTHVWTQQEVNYRNQPVVRWDTLIGRLYPKARMRVLEDPAQAWQKLGRRGQWLHVQVEPNGPQGWIAAWYVVGPSTHHEETTGPTTHVRVHSEVGLNVRAAPRTDGARVWHVPDGTVLEMIDPWGSASKVGKQGQWVKIRTPSLHEGYVAAWYLRADVGPDNRRLVSDDQLPLGNCAWTFGIHAAGSDDPVDFRHLFAGSGKSGWILFTEGIGAHPSGQQPNPGRRQRLWNWANDGYGVMIRLNHSYGAGGTLPKSGRYAAFAETCARYAELYLKHPQSNPSSYTWVIIIGNEQNNPREWPRDTPPEEPITPERYAQAFNLAYRAIKAVLPNAIVITGAVDPYNAALQRPLGYFKRMLREINETDGFALHAYTHGPHVELITKPTKFTDDPITDHYYDFLAYRPFAEAIPLSWRNRPIYITESNHWIKSDGNLGWDNRNTGWVRAAYQEIHRWNSMPHAQQIRALMLYRWLGDEWQLEHHTEVHADFRAALAHDYRWKK